MNQIRKLTPAHMILCVALLVALVLFLGAGGVGIFLIICMAMFGAMMWMMMRGSGTNHG